MKAKKLLGIWMDHSIANCSELINNTLIEAKAADKMAESQQHEFIKEYFNPAV